MPEPFSSKIVPSSEEVQDLPRQNVLHHGVHGEIPPSRGLLLPGPRIRDDVVIPVARPGADLPSGQGDVYAASFPSEGNDAEGTAYLAAWRY